MTDLDTEPRPSRWLWVSAALAALALHLGGAALALAHLQTDDFDEPGGAPAIEIGLEMMSPETEPSDLPPGPDSNASAASPEQAEQKAETKETNLPKDTPTEAENPDRVVTRSNVEKPIEEEETKTVQTSAQQASVAQEATAQPSMEAPKQGPRLVAPTQGIDESTRRMRAAWQKKLVAHLERHKRYPSEGSHKNAEIKVEFTLDRLGHVLSVKVIEGSGDPALDEAALAMVRRSDPVPKPPPLVADIGLTFTLPLHFNVKGKG